MKVKYSPCMNNTNTIIEKKNETTIVVDGVEYTQAEGPVIEMHSENGELYATVIRFYVGDCSSWDDGEYHDVPIIVAHQSEVLMKK